MVFICHVASAQSISGLVVDEHNEPIPYANLFIRELESGTSADSKGKYFLTINPGIYHVVVSAVGYTSLSLELVIPDKPITRDFKLTTSSVELNEVVVKVKRRDPAYEIMQHLAENRHKFLRQVTSSRTKVYLRASETLEVKAKTTKESSDDEATEKGPPLDVFEEARRKEEARLDKINLVEMNAVINYQYPGRYKEERTAFKAYGRKDGLFIPVFSEADFNFYHNLVDLKGISEVPVISPASKTSVLSYKYRLDEILREGNDIVYKIEVTPRKTGDATCRGYIYVNEGTWNINRLELSLPRTGLKFYDELTLKQRYAAFDSLWIPVQQEFVYEVKSGKKTFRGNTLMIFSDFEPWYTFPPRFFGDEVAVTTAEAYKRDTAFWKSNRPVPLTEDQQKMMAYRDSVEAVHTSKRYLDSIETKYNRVTIGEVLYHGVGFRKQASKRDLSFPSLIQLVGFEVVGGFRLGPSVRYFRRFENGRMIFVNSGFSVGFKNSDWQASSSVWTRYDPLHVGDFSIRAGRGFYSINNFDAYLNQLRVSNYILHEYIDLFHRRELFNGFYISTEAGFARRKSVDQYDHGTILNQVIDEGDPLKFDNYEALITSLRLAYTPGQQYMTEPNQKVILGSRYPTFSVDYRKGWNGLFGSDIDFDYLEFAISQNLQLGTLGTSKYKVMAGRFVNTRDLRFIDIKRFRQSDPYLYSDPLNSFQLLDTSLTSTNWFLEGHYIHHFNGAMINNIPFVKKLKIRTVAGGGFMWIQESNYRHEEIFGGVERVFKLGPRRRLRIGLYGILSQSNYDPPAAGYKISFDIIDTWKREWSY